MASKLKKSAVTLFFAAILLPNLVAIICGVEDWPYTPAPMFAHYVDNSTPRYSFGFVAKLSDGSTKELGYYSVGANWSLMRFFFKYVYGSVDHSSVFEEYPSDTKSAFESRLTKFFSAFVTEYEKRSNGVKVSALILQARKLEPNSKKFLEFHEVGVFKDGAFTHTYGKLG